MEASLDLTRPSPDYVIFLSKAEILALSRGECVLGYLNWKKNKVEGFIPHIILLSFLPGPKYRKIKSLLREKKVYICEGPHLFINRDTKDNYVHEIIYDRDSVPSPKTLLKNDNYLENRFDSFTQNKIFLYYKDEK